MRGVIFFAYLCFLLVKGYDFVYTGMLHNSPGYATHDITKTQQVKFPGKCILNEDFEGEDEDKSDYPVLLRKDKPASRKYLFLPHAFIAGHLCCFKNRPYFRSRLLFKYITQRALRI